MNDHAEFEWLDAHALGTLDASEAARIEAHLRACSECRREYEALRSVIDVLPTALAEAPAPAPLRERIMAAIDDAPPRAARRSVPALTALAATLALALVGDAYFFAQSRNKPREVRVVVAPSPPERSSALIAALRTGKVYAIDGAVGTQPWHLTIVAPRHGGHALIFSGTPGAPAGDTYRTWVVRAGRTVEIGELPPNEPATLQMPMALKAGDVIAFSRERVGGGDRPSQPFLMQFTVPH